MRSKTLAFVLAVAALLVPQVAAHAQAVTVAVPPPAAPVPVPVPVGPTPPPPSPFETGLHGFSMGLFAGLAGGYLVARDGGFHERDWRPLVAGVGIGALAGGLLSLSLGIADNNAAVPGRGFLIVRDMEYGGIFGATAGAIAGGLASLETNHAENILFGAAIGTLSGTVLGLVYGSVERNPWAPRRYAWAMSVAPCRTVEGTMAWGPALSGHF